MKTLVCVLTLFASSLWAAQTPGRSGNAVGGWLNLFDENSLDGWVPEQGARWRVNNRSIVGDAGGDGWLRSKRQFGDFTLKIEFNNAARGNSGIFLRATEASNPADPSNPLGGYELQINNEDDTWKTGSIENFIQRLLPVAPAPNAWHSYVIDVHGDHLVATLDGSKVLDGRNARFKTGHIGLQHHKDNAISFRHIAIKPAIEPVIREEHR